VGNQQISAWILHIGTSLDRAGNHFSARLRLAVKLLRVWRIVYGKSGGVSRRLSVGTRTEKISRVGLSGKSGWNFLVGTRTEKISEWVCPVCGQELNLVGVQIAGAGFSWSAKARMAFLTVCGSISKISGRMPSFLPAHSSSKKTRLLQMLDSREGGVGARSRAQVRSLQRLFIVEGHWNSGRCGEGEKERMEILEANPCPTCSKGSVDRLGCFEIRPI